MPLFSPGWSQYFIYCSDFSHFWFYKKMDIRGAIIAVLTLVFTCYLVLHQLFTTIIWNVTAPLMVLQCTRARISSILHGLKLGGNAGICRYIQVITNSSISLMLAYGILHFHQHFISLIVLISHNVHHWFLQFIVPLPDYSILMQESYSLKLGLCYLYLLFGYLGLSAQIVLTVDLIYFFNLPTIIVYKLLAKLYQLLMKVFKIIMDILTIEREFWITCPYNQLLMRDSFKVFCIAVLPILGFLLVVVIFYYLWLTLVITALRIIMNMSLNAGLMVDQLGLLLCILKGIDQQSGQRKEINHSNKIVAKLQKMKKLLSDIQWQVVFQYKMFSQIFKGNDLLQPQKIPQIPNVTSFQQIHKTFTSLSP